MNESITYKQAMNMGLRAIDRELGMTNDPESIQAMHRAARDLTGYATDGTTNGVDYAFDHRAIVCNGEPVHIYVGMFFHGERRARIECKPWGVYTVEGQDMETGEYLRRRTFKREDNAQRCCVNWCLGK